MLNRLLFFLLIALSFIGHSQLEHSGSRYKGLQGARDQEGKFWLLNKHDIKVIQVDSIAFNIVEVMSAIEATTLTPQEKKLIRNMVDAMPNDNAKRLRIWGVSRNFLAAEPIVMEACYSTLLIKYGKRKLKKMLRKRK